MKKVMFLALVSVMFAFASCGTGNEKGNTDADQNKVENTTEANTDAEGKTDSAQVAGAQGEATQEVDAKAGEAKTDADAAAKAEDAKAEPAAEGQAESK